MKDITDGTSKTMLLGESTNITEDVDGEQGLHSPNAVGLFVGTLQSVAGHGPAHRIR